VRTIRNIAKVVFIIVGLLTSATLFYIFSFYSQSTNEQFDCAVVFGAAVWPGGEPSHALSDRTHSAIDAYEHKQVSCLVFSGADSAYDKHEVDVMLDIASGRAVELEDVELDYTGINTKQTIEHLQKDRSYLLVSNDFHLARISLLARKAGIEKFAPKKSEYAFGRYAREPFFVMREVVAFWFYALRI